MAEARRKETARPMAFWAGRGWTLLRAFPWYGVAGSVLIFGSWILENRLAAELVSQLVEMDRSQLTVDLQQMRFEDWLRDYNNRRADSTATLANQGTSAAKALQSLTQLGFYSEFRLKDDEAEREAIAESNAERRRQQQAWMREARWERIIQELESEIARANATDHPTTRSRSFVEKKVKLSERRDFWETAFFLMYVLGTLLLGLQYALGKVAKHRSGA